jgi:hypothetical protein
VNSLIELNKQTNKQTYWLGPSRHRGTPNLQADTQYLINHCYGNHREIGSVWRWHPFCLKHRGTPLVDLLRGASFVGEISPLEDLALRLGKQGLTHFSTHWIRCKGRPAYITVNEPLTLTLPNEPATVRAKLLWSKTSRGSSRSFIGYATLNEPEVRGMILTRML